MRSAECGMRNANRRIGPLNTRKDAKGGKGGNGKRSEVREQRSDETRSAERPQQRSVGVSPAVIHEQASRLSHFADSARDAKRE